MEEKGKRAERRCYQRKEAPVLVRPSAVFGRESQVGNISPGGMCICSQKHYQIGQTLKIEFSLRDSEWTEANLRVVWTKKQNPVSGPPYDIGCEFVDLPFDAQNELWVLLDSDSPSH